MVTHNFITLVAEVKLPIDDNYRVYVAHTHIDTRSFVAQTIPKLTCAYPSQRKQPVYINNALPPGFDKLYLCTILSIKSQALINAVANQRQ